MNIVLIGPAHPLRGGLATYDERLATALQDQGHKVTMYSFSLQYPSFLFPGKTQLTDEPAPAHLTIKTVINSVNPFNWLKVGSMLKKERPDLVIVRYWIPFMGPCLGTILRIAKKNRHTHVLCIADNVLPHERRPGDVPFTRYFLKSVDSFVTMSKKVLSDLAQFSSKRARYSPHPLYDNFGDLTPRDTACARLGLDPAEKYLLFFGFIRRYKGLDMLLEAMKDERIKTSGLKLIVAGEFYEDKTQYEQQMQELGNAVLPFTDFIPNSEVANYFSVADLIVQPYRNATNSGITQVAYHFEKPMIVTNVGGLHEVVLDGKTGFVAEPNPKSIADAIIKFFQPESIPNLQQNLREEKRKYSWEVFIDALMDTAFPGR